jgi:hypothetical protein
VSGAKPTLCRPGASPAQLRLRCIRHAWIIFPTLSEESQHSKSFKLVSGGVLDDPDVFGRVVPCRPNTWRQIGALPSCNAAGPGPSDAGRLRSMVCPGPRATENHGMRYAWICTVVPLPFSDIVRV